MSKTKKRPEAKSLFEDRMHFLLPNEKDFEDYNTIIHIPPKSFIRCNTLKISPAKLLLQLSKKWSVIQPFPDFPEIMLVLQDLSPGELGKSIEHNSGLYYIQELSSMLPILALNPKPEELILDLCASPGSKTTQAAAKMENKGTIIANDVQLNRIKILISNIERCGVTNTIITKKDALRLCDELTRNFQRFDKILLDAPCSGEGTLRSSPETFKMWNYKVIKSFSRIQKKFIAKAFRCLKKGGFLVYSTCTHAPEENELVVDFALKNFPVRLEKITLPLKCRPGIKNWKSSIFNSEVVKTCRVYPQDNDSEGFFVSKFRLLEELK